MSVVSKAITPIFLIGFSGVALFVSGVKPGPTMAGAGCVAVNVALQLMFVRRFALGGKLALLYPLLLALSAVPLLVLCAGAKGAEGARGANGLGASRQKPKKPVYQYRLNDVIDRVRDIVGDRIGRSPDDFRERVE
ncbi:unnamed protein product [Pylaiella littoralis]